MKKTLFVSVLTIVLCFSLISGATFALFTSESNVNISVTSGKVEVAATVQNLSLYSMDKPFGDNFENGGTAVYENGVLTLDKMTPGDKVEFEIKVINSSNVDIQYKINWTVQGKLAEVLVIKSNDKELEDLSWTKWEKDSLEKEIVIDVIVKLPVEVDNDYQNETCDIIFAVEAVQGNAADTEVAYSIEELINAASDPSVKEIILGSDINIETPQSAGHSIILRHDKIIDLNGYSINNPVNINGSGVSSLFAIASGNIVIKNSGTLNNSDENSDDTNSVIYVLGGTTTIEGGEYLAGGNSSVYNNAVWAGSNGHVIINDGYFYSNYVGNDVVELLYVSSNGIITINGGFFECENDCSRTLNAQDSGNGKFYINGGTFVNYNPADPEQDDSHIFIGENCEVIAEVQANGDIWYTVVQK